MKVRVSFTVDIDPESWTDTYGIEGSAAIREDVKAYAEIVVKETFRENGLAGLPRDGSVRKQTPTRST